MIFEVETGKYSCDICKKNYIDENTMEQHMLISHGHSESELFPSEPPTKKIRMSVQEKANLMIEIIFTWAPFLISKCARFLILFAFLCNLKKNDMFKGVGVADLSLTYPWSFPAKLAKVIFQKHL